MYREEAKGAYSMIEQQRRAPISNARAAVHGLVCAAFLGVSMAGCGGAAAGVTQPSVIGPISQFTPPAQYALWWDLTKTCSGLSRDVSQVRWYAADASTLQTTEDAGSAGLAGQWNAATNSIFLIQAAEANPGIVRHEMLHALIVASGHPANEFGSACAGFVDCFTVCAQSVGALPTAPATAARVTINDVTVRQRLFPATIDMSKDPDGWFALIVELRNPLTYPVWVRLTPFAGRSGTAMTFGYASPTGAHQSYVDGDSVSLMPGETKREVFDLKAKDFLAETPSGSIRGVFNTDSLPAIKLNVTGR